MKVGVLQFFSWPDRRIPVEEVYRRAMQRIEVMDRTGYDAVWLAEHHFSSFSVCPSIHLVGAHVAARTERLRIGTGISLAPFYNPLRLAEEVALLDVLSGGRVNWGVGRGYQSGEFEAFGVDPNDSYALFRENLEIVLAAWTHERLDFEGRFATYRGVEVLPKPTQTPHPPVWLAASSPEAIGWAGEQGFSIMFDPHSPHPRIAEKRELYREALERQGHSIQGRDLPMARLLAVAETESEAEAIARAGAEWTVGSHQKKGLSAAPVQSAANQKRPELALGGIFSDGAVERYLNETILWGTPARVLDEIARLEDELFLNYLLLAPLSHSSFELFTERVLPHLSVGATA